MTQQILQARQGHGAYLCQLQGFAVRCALPVDGGQFAEQGIGFIATEDGREYYFSRDNVVTPPFEHLAVGTPVHFIEEVAGEGLQAKRVSAHGKGLA